MTLRYIFLREGLPVNQELTFWAILSGQQAPSIQLSLSSSTGVKGYTSHLAIYMWVLEIQTQIFLIVYQAVDLPSYLHSTNSAKS